MDLEPAVATRLLLVRHGQTHTSRDDTFCGVTEVPLTAIGCSQSQYLAERLRRTPWKKRYGLALRCVRWILVSGKIACVLILPGNIHTN